MTVMYERVCWSRLMRGGGPRPIARPKRSIWAGVAPTTCAIRGTGTSGQFRHTKACKRSGKCGKDTGGGATPLGRSVGDSGDAMSPGAVVGHEPRARPPAMALLVLRKARRERVGCSLGG